MIIPNAKNFSDSGIILIPPNPPLENGGTTRNCWESPPLKKGDLGGFENLQGERIYGKRYNFMRPSGSNQQVKDMGRIAVCKP